MFSHPTVPLLPLNKFMCVDKHARCLNIQLLCSTMLPNVLGRALLGTHCPPSALPRMHPHAFLNSHQTNDLALLRMPAKKPTAALLGS